MTCYLTHDNGGNPFMVMVSDESVKVFVQSKEEEDGPPGGMSLTKSQKVQLYDVMIANFESYQKVFVPTFNWPTFLHGRFGPIGPDDGNTILVQLQPHEYVYIGNSIYKFKTRDEILGFFSPVGANDVPYATAIGRKFVYFMDDRVFVPKEEIPSETKELDLYDFSHSPNRQPIASVVEILSGRDLWKPEKRAEIIATMGVNYSGPACPVYTVREPPKVERKQSSVCIVL